jgi:hypothetical protein
MFLSKKKKKKNVAKVINLWGLTTYMPFPFSDFQLPLQTFIAWLSMCHVAVRKYSRSRNISQ